MASEVEQAVGLIRWWKELTILFIALLGLFGMTRKKGVSKLLVTQEYLDTELELCTEKIKNSFKDGIKEAIKEVYDEIHRVDKRVDDHLNNG